jgi:tripartite-type tricarboxylate transporter receptor subunit TctC
MQTVSLWHRWVLGIVGACMAGLAMAQPYPARPVKLVVPFAAGGGPDIEARRLAPKLAEALGGTTVVENRVGAAGILAAEVVTQAPPDGYTLLVGSLSQVIQKILRPEAKFDPLSSFVPVGEISTASAVLVVPSDSPIKSARELEALIRSKPGQLNYGSGGIGTAAHIAGATFANVLKLNAIHVPYRGSVELVPALLSQQIQFAFPISGTAVPYVKSGKVRALAVTGNRRMSALPDVPTLKELYGEDLFVHEYWSGLWAPANTPAAVVQQLFNATRKALADPELRAHLIASGSEPEPSESPEAFARLMKAETPKWARLIQMSGVKAD